MGSCLRSLLAVSVLLAAGCGSRRAPSEAAPPPDGSAAVARSPEKPSLRFRVRAELEQEARVFPVDGAVLVDLGELAVESAGELIPGIRVGLVDARGVRLESSLRIEALLAAPSVAAIRGRYPAVDVVHVERGGPFPSLTHHSGKVGPDGAFVGWSRPSHGPTAEMLGWVEQDAELVALVGPPSVGIHAGVGASFWALRGPRVDRVFSLSDTCPLAHDGKPRQTVVHGGFGQGALGELIAYGRHCDDEHPMLEVWAPKARTSTLVELPMVNGKLDNDGPTPALVDSALRTTWVVGQRIWRYRESRWQTIDPPVPTKWLRAAALSRDGILWVVQDGALYAHTGERWQRIELPASQVEQVTAGRRQCVGRRREDRACARIG